MSTSDALGTSIVPGQFQGRPLPTYKICWLAIPDRLAATTHRGWGILIECGEAYARVLACESRSEWCRDEVPASLARVGMTLAEWQEALSLAHDEMLDRGILYLTSYGSVRASDDCDL